jgi:hypothetical protein
MMQNGWVRPGIPGMGQLSSGRFPCGRAFVLYSLAARTWLAVFSFTAAIISTIVGDKNSIREPRKGT